MKILAFVVRVECEACNGKKRVLRRAEGTDPNRETVDCWRCDGLGHVEAVTAYEDFARLIHGLSR